MLLLLLLMRLLVLRLLLLLLLLLLRRCQLLQGRSVPRRYESNLFLAGRSRLRFHGESLSRKRLFWSGLVCLVLLRRRLFRILIPGESLSRMSESSLFLVGRSRRM